MGLGRRGVVGLLGVIIFASYLLHALAMSRWAPPVMARVDGTLQNAHLLMAARIYVAACSQGLPLTMGDVLGRLYQYNDTLMLPEVEYTIFSRDGVIGVNYSNGASFYFTYDIQKTGTYIRVVEGVHITFINYTLYWVHEYDLVSFKFSLYPELRAEGYLCSLNASAEGVWVLGVPLEGTCRVSDKYGITVVVNGTG